MKKLSQFLSCTSLIVTSLLSINANAAETVRLCSGTPGKTYYAVAQKLAELIPRLSAGQLQVEVIATEGSIDNLSKILNNECDSAIVQGDALDFFVNNINQDAKGKIRRQSALYKELSFLLCSRESGVEEIEDLLDIDNASVAAGAMGSGSLATWLTFRSIKPAYAKVKVLPENGAAGALAVARGEASCLLEVIAPQSDFIASLDANKEIGKALLFAEVDDGFDGYKADNQRIYTRVEFDDEKYDNISTWGDPELIAITAYLVVGESWAQQHAQGLGALSMATLTGQADIEAVAYGEEKPFQE